MELLDVVDINGNPTGETVAREVAPTSRLKLSKITCSL